ncbi:MAG: hypothetical protein BWY76_02623 [bacterium ADurb.Bin429]|nr:MAG: hypothetical protein BWY76_02623 [bacterium ADurb.Bin429]
MVTCPRCGAENKAGRRACWNCWTPLAADDTPAPPLDPPTMTDALPPAEPPSPSLFVDAVLPADMPEMATGEEIVPQDQPTDVTADDQPAAVPPTEDDPGIVPPAEPAIAAEPPVEEPEPPGEDVVDDLPAPMETDVPPAEVIEEMPPVTDAPPALPVAEEERIPDDVAVEEDEPLPAHEFTFVAEPVVRASRRGEWWLLGITIALAALIVSVVLVWYFSFRAQPRAETPTEVAQAYLNALTSGNTVEQAQFATADSKSRRLPGGWLMVNTAARTGDAAARGDTAGVPMMMTVIVILPGSDPAVPPVPVTVTCAVTLPLTRESAAWRVDQTAFFRNLRDALATEMPGTALPVWE